MSVIPHANHTLTKRFTNVGSLGQAISFLEWAIKKLFIHFEGATPIGIIKGSGTVTGSGDAHWTSNGTTIELDGMWDPGAVITTIYTPTANGADKIVNGAFTTDTGWDKAAGWTIPGAGGAVHTTGNATAIVETSTTVVNGEQYLLTYTISATTTAGTLTPSAGGVTLTARTGVLALATTASPAGGTGCTVTVDTVSSTGEALTVSVVAGGADYAVGDILSVTFAAATRPLKLEVLTLSTTAVATVKIVDFGLGYEVTGASKTYSEEFTAVSTAKVTFTADALWAGTIDDVKMYKVTPVVVSLLAWR
jgi:hypothetical protein